MTTIPTCTITFCTKCRKIFDIPADISPDIVKKAEEATGFKIDTHEIVFHGECSDCKIKGEENGVKKR